MEDNSDNNVNDPAAAYGSNFRIFNSFEEQEEYELKQMASLSSKEVLQQLRMLINTAYGMHGYDPNNLPKVHSIRIIKGELL